MRVNVIPTFGYCDTLTSYWDCNNNGDVSDEGGKAVVENAFALDECGNLDRKSSFNYSDTVMSDVISGAPFRPQCGDMYTLGIDKVQAHLRDSVGGMIDLQVVGTDPDLVTQPVDGAAMNRKTTLQGFRSQLLTPDSQE